MTQMEQQRLPPGFRFSPTDEELVVHYLKNKACGRDYHQGFIAEVDIYKHEPWDLPEKSALPGPDPVWYFFNAQDKRHQHSARINRTTSKGYWKATGKDRKICNGPHIVGTKKTLIYYEGRAPSGKRTDWIMHEYKLDEDFEKRSKVVSSPALCRIRKKGGPGPRNGEQFGAPVFNENGEWVEDADDEVDEKIRIPLSYGAEAVAPSLPANQVKVPKEELVLLDTPAEGCSSNDLQGAESVDLDLNTFLETFLSDNVEVTNLQAGMESTHDINQAMFTPFEVERLLGLDGTHVHNIIQPTCNEEQILGELLHLTGDSQFYAGIPDFNARMSYQGLTDKGSDVHAEFAPSITKVGDYIEMNDLNYPLDGFVLRSPTNYSGIEQQLPPDLFDDMEVFGGLSDLINTQGEAARRIRLQVDCSQFDCLQVGQRAIQTSMQQSGLAHKLHSDPPESCGLNVTVDSSFDDDRQELLNASSGLGSASNDIIRESSTKRNVIDEHMPAGYMAASYKQTKKEKQEPSSGSTAPAHSLVRIIGHMNKTKVQPAVVDAVSFVPSLLRTSSFTQEANCEAVQGVSPSEISNMASPKCEVGPSTKVSFSEISNMASLKCEVGPSTKVPLEPCKHLGSSESGNQGVGHLVRKVKTLTLSDQLADLESNLSSTFNDKVFALGKPVAQLFPSDNCVNPYCSLRSGAIASLRHLGVAVFVLFVLFFGIHLFTKYFVMLAA